MSFRLPLALGSASAEGAATTLLQSREAEGGTDCPCPETDHDQWDISHSPILGKKPHFSQRPFHVLHVLMRRK